MLKSTFFLPRPPTTQPAGQAHEVPRGGTTLITVTTDDGIVIAADDQMHFKGYGPAVPPKSDVKKVRVLDNNILIGTSGLMSHAVIGYNFDDWITEFIQTHQYGTVSKRPSDIAVALSEKLRVTFKALEATPDDDVWRTINPGQVIVTYIIAGYAETFHRPYVFDLTVTADTNSRIRYLPISRRSEKFLYGGEFQSLLRAYEGAHPEASLWKTIVDGLDIRSLLPNIPHPLQDLVADIVGYVKLEAHFNPQKVGNGVCVAVIDRRARSTCTAMV